MSTVLMAVWYFVQRNPWVLQVLGFVAIVLGLIVGVAYVHHKGYTDGRDEVRAEWAKANDLAAAQAEKQRLATEDNARKEQAALAANLTQIKERHQNALAKLRREIQSASVYTTCVVPDSGMRLYNNGSDTPETSN